MDPKLKEPIVNEQEQEETVNEQDNIEPTKDDKKEKGYKEGLHDDTTITNADGNNEIELDDPEAGKTVNE